MDLARQLAPTPLHNPLRTGMPQEIGIPSHIVMVLYLRSLEYRQYDLFSRVFR